MASKVMQSYSELTPGRERLAALNGLVRSLTENECLALLSLITDRLDPLSRLPIELVIELFEHLPLPDVWRLRSINKRWNTVLSSELVTTAALVRWDSHSPADCGRSPHSTATDTLATRLRNMQATYLARPFTFVELAENVIIDSSPALAPQLPTCDMKGDIVAFLRGQPGQEGTSRELVVRNLRTGGGSAHFGEAREAILCLALSANLIAFVSHRGMVYMRRIDGLANSVSQIHLPSTSVRAVAADEDVVALVLGGSTENLYTVMVHDNVTGATRDFTFLEESVDVNMEIGGHADHAPGLFLTPYAMLVKSEKRIVDVFSMGLYQIFRHAQYTFEGKRISTSTIRYTERYSSAIKRTIYSSQVLPNGRADSFDIWTSSQSYDELVMKWKCVVFNRASATLWTEDWYRQPIRSGHPDMACRFRFATARWKSTTVTRERGIRAGVNAYRAVGEEDLFLRLLESVPGQLSVVGPYAVLMRNESFLVGFSSDNGSGERSCIRVWCFDEKIEMPGARNTGLWELKEEERLVVKQDCAEIGEEVPPEPL